MRSRHWRSRRRLTRRFAARRSRRWRRSAARWGVRRSRPWPRRLSQRALRILAVAALARLDVGRRRGAGRRDPRQAASQGRDLTPLLAAFLNRQGGADVLAAALGRQAVPADSAKLALRAVYALGRADPALVAALRRAAGICRRDQAADAGRAQPARRRGRRQGRSCARRAGLPPRRPELHELPRRSARPAATSAPT